LRIKVRARIRVLRSSSQAILKLGSSLQYKPSLRASVPIGSSLDTGGAMDAKEKKTEIDDLPKDRMS